MTADQCLRCAALRGEVADWRRLYQTLARSIAAAAQARQADEATAQSNKEA